MIFDDTPPLLNLYPTFTHPLLSIYAAFTKFLLSLYSTFTQHLLSLYSAIKIIIDFARALKSDVLLLICYWGSRELHGSGPQPSNV